MDRGHGNQAIDQLGQGLSVKIDTLLLFESADISH